jgi:hypothetical protein
MRSGRAEDQFGWGVTTHHLVKVGSAIERVTVSWTVSDDARNWQDRFILDIGHELSEQLASRVRQSRKEKNIENPLGFSVKRGPKKTSVNIPHPWLVAMFAFIAVAPWLKFSLRTLLIAVTIVALLFGAAVSVRSKSEVKAPSAPAPEPNLFD